MVGTSLPRRRLLVVGLAVAVAAALALGIPGGSGSLAGTTAPNDPPSVEVTVEPGDPGEATVAFAGTGDREEASLTVAWNGSAAVVEGDPRLEAVGDAVVIRESGTGDTAVQLTVTATGDGDPTTVYRRTVDL